MKKLTKNQQRLWNKVQVRAILNNSVACCITCPRRVEYAAVGCSEQKKPTIKFFCNYSKNNRWELSLLPSANITEIPVWLCNKFFEKKKIVDNPKIV